MKFLLTVLLTISVYKSVYGATCSEVTSVMCEATNFTTSKCQEDICVCKDGYVPIPSGCAMKLSKPMVKLPEGRLPMLISTTSGELECYTSETDIVSYIWYKDGTKLTETKMKLSVNGAGKYSCQIAPPTNNDTSDLTSDQSDALTISVVAANTVVSERPSIVASSIPAKAAIGVTLKPICGNVPMGTTILFQDQAGEEKTPVVTADGFVNITCKAEASGITFSNAMSAMHPMPQTTADIEKAMVMIGSTASGYVFAVDASVIVTCESVPPENVMNVQATTVSYEIFVNDKSVATTKTHTLTTSTVGEQKVHCKATYDDQEAKTSEPVTVTISKDYISKPKVMASGTQLVAKSRLVLTCEAAEGTVSWKKDGNNIYRQHDHIIQYDGVAAAEAARYTCVAMKDNYMVESDAVVIKFVGAISPPTIDSTVDTFYGKGDDYNLTCKTDSSTVGMKYSWARDTTDLKVASHLYEIKDAADTNSGNYTCTVSFNDNDAVSAKVEILIEAAGQKCTQDSGCKGELFTGKCTDNRCVCADGYVQKGSTCKSHATAIVSSIFLVLAMALVSKIF